MAKFPSYSEKKNMMVLLKHTEKYLNIGLKVWNIKKKHLFNRLWKISLYQEKGNENELLILLCLKIDYNTLISLQIFIILIVHRKILFSESK